MIPSPLYIVRFLTGQTMLSLHQSSVGASLLLIEAGLAFIAIAVAFCRPRVGMRWSLAVEQTFAQLARRRVLSVFAVSLSALMLRLLFIPFSPIPQPSSPDEFSNLLAADTFASRRLTNPTHSMWMHFESFHIDQKPTYMSMYFPAQGLVLAAGKAVAGNAWYGVLASSALMCGLICWMLQGWLPTGWALFGGMLAVLRLGLFSYWVDSYWGGAVAALGGALVLGALPRLRRTLRTRDFVWIALGMAILANSRPYEGLLVCVPDLLVLWWWVRKGPRPAPSVVIRRIAPAAVLLAATFTWMGYYNHRVFGSALIPPYAVNRATYASAPHFFFQSPRPVPVFRHAVMREYYSGWELEHFLKFRTFSGFLQESVMKLVLAGMFFLGFALLLPLIMLPRALSDRRIRFLAITSLVFAAGLGLETWFIPHYASPFTAGFYAILLQCMRHLRTWRPGGQPSGLFLVRAIPVICLALAGLRLYAHPLHIEIDGYPNKAWYGGTRPLGFERAQVLKKLESFEGQQLAIVRYGPRHSIFDEWVYNAADIDKSKVVWARDMDPARNRELIQYFNHRRIWLVEPDFHPPKLLPYVTACAPSSGQVPSRPGLSTRLAADYQLVR